MSQSFDALVEVIAQLRGPNGCPWDAKQTHASLQSYLLEEAYEVLDALEAPDSPALKEELGDLLLQILLHAQIAAEGGRFTIEDVIRILIEKLIRRHPHVFKPDPQQSNPLLPEQISQQWEAIKQHERQHQEGEKSLLDGVPQTLPALLRAYQIQRRVSRVGFDWQAPRQVVDKLHEELEELRKIVEALPGDSSKDLENDHTHQAIEREFGDVLFTIANLARFLHVNPEAALRKATKRFTTRFQYMEQHVRKAGKSLNTLQPEEWEALWQEAKQQEAQEHPRQVFTQKERNTTRL
ncbi:MAG: nucleoside triphosphate pyrophosphohydrolase [Nitrospirae bacterium]|nr:MAG: nucleoside triphosphate pyrophosphohydrolase [Nitrospirota bacterium]